jgi:hypothetical protein
MKAFESELAKYLYFSCLAVDRHSRAYEPKPYPHAWYEYNRFTAMALKAGIAWHIGPEYRDRVNIQFVSDAKQRVARPDLGMVDNFEKYLPYRAELDAFLSEASGRRYPGHVQLKVQLNDSKSDDLLQLTDLFLGAIQMALVGASSRPVKRTLGTFAVRWCRDIRKKPWEQALNLHRRFSFWAFPDWKGRPYTDVPLSLEVDSNQLALF